MCIRDRKITVCLSTEAESVFDLVFAGREEDAPLEAIHIKGCLLYTSKR